MLINEFVSITNRITIQLTGGSTSLYTKSGLKISNGYNRIVVGDRGAYIEIDESNICKTNLLKINTTYHYFYIEYRTIDMCKVKVYYQHYRVNYADYIPFKYYVNPLDVYDDKGNRCMLDRPSDQIEIDF